MCSGRRDHPRTRRAYCRFRHRNLGKAHIGLVGEKSIAQPVIAPGGVEVAVVRYRLVVVAHVGGKEAIDEWVLAKGRREGHICDAEVGTEGYVVTRDRA